MLDYDNKKYLVSAGHTFKTDKSDVFYFELDEVIHQIENSKLNFRCEPEAGKKTENRKELVFKEDIAIYKIALEVTGFELCTETLKRGDLVNFKGVKPSDDCTEIEFVDIKGYCKTKYNYVEMRPEYFVYNNRMAVLEGIVGGNSGGVILNNNTKKVCGMLTGEIGHNQVLFMTSSYLQEKLEEYK